MKKTPHKLSFLKQIPRVWLGVMILGLFCTLSYPVLAKEARVFIVPPQGDVIAGKMTRFILFFHNPEKKVMTTNAYNRVMVTIKKDNQQIVMEATPWDAASALVTIPGNGYEKREYQFLLPQSMDGNISISLEAFALGPVWFVAKEMPFKDRTEQFALNEKESIIHPLAKYLFPYEPMYFLVGVDPGTEKSKFQLSFKYKIFNYTKKNGGWKYFLGGIHVAYTQTSFWDLSSDSASFEDTNYKPELFYLIPKIDLGIPFIKAFGIQSGYRHESNGKDGADSRSTNYLYIEPILAFSLGNNYFLKLAPRVWTYINNVDSTNSDLDQYRGYFNFQLSAGNPDGFILDTNTRWADKGPSFQADLSYPLKTSNKGIGFYLHLQYFNGYAENLLHYQQKDESIRLGLSIVR
jgi:outer membrane phospholipase A